MGRLMPLALVVALALLPCATFADGPQQEANKKTVVAFYEAAINQKDFEAASKYLGPRYVQHNPNAADGRRQRERNVLAS